MDRIPDPPAGSIIEQREEGENMTLFWRQPSGGCGRFFSAGFLAFWLCGWAVGEFFALQQLIAGNVPLGVQLFLLAWLGGWTIGGAFAMFALWAAIRPPRPESITLGFDTLRYDPGTGAWLMLEQHHGRRHPSTYPDPSVRRKPVTVSRSDVKGFTLDRAGERQRLTFDCGADRIEIGAFLREPEREWLHAVLQRWLH